MEPKESLKEQFNSASPQLLELLELLLQINPYYRPSASTLLKMSIFDKVRSQADDSLMKLNHKIIIKVDSKFPVDYEGEFMESVLTISQLKSLIIQQCVKLDSLKAS